jgi:hypothetical protein
LHKVTASWRQRQVQHLSGAFCKNRLKTYDFTQNFVWFVQNAIFVYNFFANIFAQVKRNKEFIATGIQEIFNPFQVAQVSQSIDLQKLFMHQLQQQVVPLSSQMIPLQLPQLQPAAAVAEDPITNGGTIANPLLNGCTTLVTNTNINVTYLNGAINGINKQYEAEKFKMHQGFIAVLKVISC